LHQSQFDDPRDLSVDAGGNLYVTDWSLAKVGLNKYTPTPDAPHTRMVGLGFNRYLPRSASVVMRTQ
jgi:hypothetical protein